MGNADSTFRLRALAGIILLVLALASILLQYETDSVKYVILALAAFLVGGSMIGRTSDNISTQKKDEN